MGWCAAPLFLLRQSSLWPRSRLLGRQPAATLHLLHLLLPADCVINTRDGELLRLQTSRITIKARARHPVHRLRSSQPSHSISCPGHAPSGDDLGPVLVAAAGTKARFEGAEMWGAT